VTLRAKPNEVPQPARLPAAHRPAVSLAQQGYGCFEDFPGSLNSRHRKAIRRERRERSPIAHHDPRVDRQRHHRRRLGRLLAFYMETGSRKWAAPMSPAASSHWSARAWLRTAAGDGQTQCRWIAGAINFIGSDTCSPQLGPIEHHPFLHFESATIRPSILRSRAPENRRGRRPGRAQDRPRLPAPNTFSAHYIADTGLRHAIDEYLKRERLCREPGANSGRPDRSEKAPTRRPGKNLRETP